MGAAWQLPPQGNLVARRCVVIASWDWGRVLALTLPEWIALRRQYYTIKPDGSPAAGVGHVQTHKSYVNGVAS